jgi:aldehyde dehydrogenase (NAD+)
MPDADPKRAAQIIVQGAFNLTGQACTATSRAIVVGDGHDAVIAEVAALAAAMTVGDGMDKATRMGPVATHGQYEKLRWLWISRDRKDWNRCSAHHPCPNAARKKADFSCPR